MSLVSNGNALLAIAMLLLSENINIADKVGPFNVF